MAAFIDRVMAEFFLLLQAPLIVPEMWWIVIPLIVILLLITKIIKLVRCSKIGYFWHPNVKTLAVI